MASLKGVRVARLRIRDYRGVEDFDKPIAPSGMIVHGPNGAGKTSILNAIRAALIGRDIGDDAIRHGADRAEILVDLGAPSVRRVITSGGSTLDVKDGSKKVAAPQKWLKELLGTSPIDPIEFYRGSPAERRKAILAAIPVALDTAKAQAAIPAELAAEFHAQLEPIFANAGHALTAASALAQVFFDARTDTNRVWKAAEADAQKIVDAGPIPAAMMLPPATALQGARDDLAALHARAKRAASQAEAVERTTTRIVSLRTRAKAALDPDPQPPVEGAVTNEDLLAEAEREILGGAEAERLAGEAWREADARVAQIQAALEKANRDLVSAHDYVKRSKEKTEKAEQAKASALAAIAAEAEAKTRNERTAREWIAQADELQQSLALSEAAPATIEIANAEAKVQRLEMQTNEYEIAMKRREAFERASKAASTGQRKAEQLTRVIDHFRTELPKQLIGSTSGIEGLQIDGDRILLDDVDLDACSGREQLRFAVEIARRSNAASKILICDGLETLDPEQYVEFVREATRDGFQLIGTRVDAGGIVFEHLSPEGSQHESA